MFAFGNPTNRPARKVRRGRRATERACGPALALRRRGLRFALAVAVFGWCTGYAAATALARPAAAPISITVFPFELEDFSAAVQQGSAPREAAYLAEATEEAKRQLLESGRYSVIQAASTESGMAKGQALRNCGACASAIARTLGADRALVGVVTKISMTEYTVTIQIRDVRNGAVVATYFSGLRMGADYSWSRGVRSLMENRVLAAKEPGAQ